MTSTEWVELAPQTFVRRDSETGTSAAVIVGPDGVVVVDAGGDLHEAERILADVDRRTGAPIRALVLTHAHWDHTFGAAAFVDRGIRVTGHARIADHYARYEAPRLAAWAADPASEPDREWTGVRLVVPDHVIRERAALEVIDREIELVPLRHGHTDTDIVVRIPDVDVIVAGDVIEQSGAPMFGSGGAPLGWPQEVRDLVDLAGPDTRFVPGHGEVVDRRFVTEQADAIGAAVEVARAGWGSAEELAALRASQPLSAAWSDDQLDYARGVIGAR